MRLREVLRDLRIDPNASLSPSDLARIADFASTQTILWGQDVKFGDELRIDATLQNLEQKTSTPLKATAANQAGLLSAVAQFAASVQQTLAAGSADVLNELKASAWRPSTQSFEALRLYNDGLNLSRDGNHQAALKQFEAAIREDANFALAYSALAQTYANLGYDAQAAQQSRRAVGMSESLPPQERYLIAATHYRITNDSAKGIDTYQKLLKVSPNNARLQFDLAGLYEGTGDLARAQEHFAKAVALDPKHVEGLTAVGRVAIKRGDPKASLQPLNNALSLSIQLKNDEARANVLQAIGVAYKRMGQPAEALKQYQESLAIKRQIGQRRGMAVSLMEIASIQDMIGSPQEAVKSYNEALALQREIGDKSGMTLTLIGFGVLLNESLGRPDEALPRFREALSLSREEGDRGGEALALNNIGSAYFAKGEFSEAQTYFERALDIREQAKVPEEMANTLHNLGETLGRMGKYDQALTRYLRALDLRRADGDTRGAAMESYSIGTIFDCQGRYGAAVKSKGEALQAFRGLKLRDVWLSEILGGSGYSLALSGRADEAAKHFDEAMTVARDLKNVSQEAQILRFRAENAFWKGDTKGAAQLAGEAAQAASRTSDRSLDLRGAVHRSQHLRVRTAHEGGRRRPCADWPAGGNRRPDLPFRLVRAPAGRHTPQGRRPPAGARVGGTDAGESRDARASRTAGAQRVRVGGNAAPLRRPAGPPALRGRAADSRGDEAGGRKREPPRTRRPQGHPRRVREVVTSVLIVRARTAPRSSPTARSPRSPERLARDSCRTTRREAGPGR